MMDNFSMIMGERWRKGIHNHYVFLDKAKLRETSMAFSGVTWRKISPRSTPRGFFSGFSGTSSCTCFASWRFQPNSKILVKLDHLPK